MFTCRPPAVRSAARRRPMRWRARWRQPRQAQSRPRRPPPTRRRRGISPPTRSDSPARASPRLPLPSAGVGALLALMAFNTEFSIMSLIGVILLTGIVKKNAIMMIDFALDAERRRGLSPLDAIREACLLRFRPIMMTTMAAMLGALPLAVGLGEGGELRQPLGIAIVGGLILSQVLTLYSTPVIYLYLDRFRLWSQRQRGGGAAPHAPGPSLQPGE